jgi:hypothetical protein
MDRHGYVGGYVDGYVGSFPIKFIYRCIVDVATEYQGSVCHHQRENIETDGNL